ncbi:hypothetical protein AAL_06637 [Moelleriella libera RCEF 2490]|uniref:Uncharacterized protein n=1 Tax=Moelleriella libera RCEF 2490 TaxID=1081109 RepID=A0A167YIT9_9HYPO|nr:hypothetical protein AAL_06637 [Moelleriella libera RCEF 2490]
MTMQTLGRVLTASQHEQLPTILITRNSSSIGRAFSHDGDTENQVPIHIDLTESDDEDSVTEASRDRASVQPEDTKMLLRHAPSSDALTSDRAATNPSEVVDLTEDENSPPRSEGSNESSLFIGSPVRAASDSDDGRQKTSSRGTVHSSIRSPESSLFMGRRPDSLDDSNSNANTEPMFFSQDHLRCIDLTSEHHPLQTWRVSSADGKRDSRDEESDEASSWGRASKRPRSTASPDTGGHGNPMQI